MSASSVAIRKANKASNSARRQNRPPEKRRSSPRSLSRTNPISFSPHLPLSCCVATDPSESFFADVRFPVSRGGHRHERSERRRRFTLGAGTPLRSPSSFLLPLLALFRLRLPDWIPAGLVSFGNVSGGPGLMRPGLMLTGGGNFRGKGEGRARGIWREGDGREVGGSVPVERAGL